MQKFSAAAFKALTAEECDQLLASVRDGARFRVFSLDAGEIFDRAPELLGRRVYLVQPGEWLIPQKLWYTLSAAIGGILWTAFAYSEFATLSPLLLVVVCAIFILPYAHLTAVIMQGGRDVTDAAIFQLRRKLHDVAEAEDTRDFFDDLSQRSSPVSETH